MQDTANSFSDVRGKHETELDTVAAELKETKRRIDRYLTAFESGSLPEASCAERVKELTSRAATLTSRQAELTDLLEEPQPGAPTDDQLAALRLRVREAVTTGETMLQKVLVQALVHEVRVQSREVIVPYFKMPPEHLKKKPVRAPAGLVEAGGLEPP
ncbi:MAG: hypothetical protein WD602_01560 [Actinomycetota bacterium]